MTSLGFVLRMAAREVRASPRRLLLLTASVAVGVAALVAINSFTANLRDSVRRQAQALLGADLSLESRQPLPPSAERLIDTLVGRGAEVRGSDRYGRYPSGSCATPLTSTMKWTWGPVEMPVLPTGPMTSPLETASPGETHGGSAMWP